MHTPVEIVVRSRNPTARYQDQRFSAHNYADRDAPSAEPPIGEALKQLQKSRRKSRYEKLKARRMRQAAADTDAALRRQFTDDWKMEYDVDIDAL